MLSGRVRIASEDERTQHGSVDGPRPCLSGSRQAASEEQSQQGDTAHLTISLFAV
jgi:hypothetical protein